MPAETANPTGSGSGDLGDVLGVLGRRLSVIVLVVVLAAGAAVLFSKREPKTYEASSTLLFRDSNVSQLVTGVSTSTSGAPERIAATNLGLVGLDTVAARTARRLGPPWTPTQVTRQVQARSQGQSDLIGITATDGSPATATKLANTYGQTFVEMRRASARAQINRARRQVLQELGSDKLSSARRRQLTKDADNLRLLSSVQDGSVQLVQPATPPGSPSSPRPRRDGVIGALIGLLVGIALAFLLEQLDKRLRRPEDAEKAFGLPLLAAIRRSKQLRRGMLDPDRLRPSEAEAFRRLRANLRHVGDGDVRTVVVTSAEPDSGKTTVATGLAAAAAHAHTPALLIEADTRQPRLRKLLGTGAEGLVPLLRGEGSDLEGAVAHVPLNGDPDEAFDALVADYDPHTGGDLLDTPRMRELLQEARDAYELVIVDVPPVTRAADAIPLLRRVDGVVVVARLGRDSRDDAERLGRVLANLDVKPLGVVATFARRRDGDYDDGGPARRR